MIKLKSRLRELLGMDRPNPSMYTDQGKLEILKEVGRAVRHRDALDRIYTSLGYASSSEPVGLKLIESRIRSAIACAAIPTQQKVQELERLVGSYKKSNQILQDSINEINLRLPELASVVRGHGVSIGDGGMSSLIDAVARLVQEKNNTRRMLEGLYTTALHKAADGKSDAQIQEEVFRHIRKLETENIHLRHDLLKYEQGPDEDND